MYFWKFANDEAWRNTTILPPKDKKQQPYDFTPTEKYKPEKKGDDDPNNLPTWGAQVSSATNYKRIK